MPKTIVMPIVFMDKVVRLLRMMQIEKEPPEVQRLCSEIYQLLDEKADKVIRRDEYRADFKL